MFDRKHKITGSNGKEITRCFYAYVQNSDWEKETYASVFDRKHKITGSNGKEITRSFYAYVQNIVIGKKNGRYLQARSIRSCKFFINYWYFKEMV